MSDTPTGLAWYGLGWFGMSCLLKWPNDEKIAWGKVTF